MTELRAEDPSARVERAYARIADTRMAGLPFLNPALRVEAVGFRAWEGQWLGALVTPWCLNLLLLPGTGEWPSLPQGGERIVTLPAGRYRFIAGHDEDLGEHHACSLFSPAQAFVDHETARAVALAALAALFDAGHAQAPDDDGTRGRPMVAPGAPAAVSKRDFLRGHFSGTPHVDRG